MYDKYAINVYEYLLFYHRYTNNFSVLYHRTVQHGLHEITNDWTMYKYFDKSSLEISQLYVL